MRVASRRRLSIGALCLAIGVAGCSERTRASPESGPGTGPWMAYAAPEDAGYETDALAEARSLADSLAAPAVMLVVDGAVLAAWGDVTEVLETRSVRKSLVNALFGQAVAEGRVDLDATLDELGIEEETPLTEAERGARVRDLLSSRSGIYLAAAAESGTQSEERPARGSHPAGAYWWYNNWDFNVAGVILERALEGDLYVAFDTRIARPLGMEDWRLSDGWALYQPARSRHPAHTFALSTRDLARFGELYRRGGVWDGRRIVPSTWVEESTRAHADLGEGRGYGYLWWTWDAGALPDGTYPGLSSHSFYQAVGTGGHMIVVVPGADLVAVVRGAPGRGVTLSTPEVVRLVDLVLRGRAGPVAPDAELRPLEVNAAPRKEESFEPLASERIDRLVGAYEFPGMGRGEVFVFRGRPFMRVPGIGEAELFQRSDGRLAVRVAPQARIDVIQDERGEVLHLRLRQGDRQVTGARVRPTLPAAP